MTSLVARVVLRRMRERRVRFERLFSSCESVCVFLSLFAALSLFAWACYGAWA